MAVSSPMASLPKPDTHMDPARQSVVRMKTLLKPTDDDASARWDKLDTEGLDQEIAAYRETIKDVIYALEGLGVSVSADEDQAAQQADGASTATGLEVLAYPFCLSLLPEALRCMLLLGSVAQQTSCLAARAEG